MGQVVYLGLCLLGCLILNPLVEGAANRTQNARSPCPPGIVFYRGYCYEYVSSKLSWSDAEESCQRYGSHLASILSAREGDIVHSYLKTYGAKSVWIGLQATRVGKKMIWEWRGRDRFSQPLWDGANISESISPKECVSLQSTDSKKWKQRSCDAVLPSLCKFKATN